MIYPVSAASLSEIISGYHPGEDMEVDLTVQQRLARDQEDMVDEILEYKPDLDRDIVQQAILANPSGDLGRSCGAS